MEREKLNCFLVRRREIAKHFLLNISLDGNRNDIKVKPRFIETSSSNKQLNDQNLKILQDEDQDLFHPTRQRSFSEGQDFPQRDRMEAIIKEDKLQLERDRTTSFLVETKVKLASLNQRRRVLRHQKSLSEPQPQFYESIENIGSQVCRSRKASTSLSESSVENELKSLKNNAKTYKEERILFITPKNSRLALFSVISHRMNMYCISRKRHASSSRQLSIISDSPEHPDLLDLLGLDRPEDGQEISYSSLLKPTLNLENSINNVIPVNPALPALQPPLSLTPPLTVSCFPGLENGIPHYHPHILDDPNFTVGKHSKVLAFTAYCSSIIEFTQPMDLKKDLNQKFKELFPNIQLTLSKLRSLKKEMLKIGHLEAGLDLYTIAQAYVYFEKIILKTLVKKYNRKICAGACLLLSAKIGDTKGQELTDLIEILEDQFRLNRKELLDYEFGILVALEFSLLIPNNEIMAHYQRLLSEL